MQQGYQQPPPQQQNYQQPPPQDGHQPYQPPQQGHHQPPPGQQYQQPPPGQGYGPHPPPKKFPVVPVLIIAVIIIVVLALLFLFVLGPGTNSMTAAEWNAEYSVYESSYIEPNFPNLNDGDTVVITGQITDIDYSGDLWGYGDTTELELDGQTLDGLEWSGNLGNTYDVGDTVEITFHINSIGYAGYEYEYIQESYLTDELPASTIKKI